MDDGRTYSSMPPEHNVIPQLTVLQSVSPYDPVRNFPQMVVAAVGFVHETDEPSEFHILMDDIVADAGIEVLQLFQAVHCAAVGAAPDMNEPLKNVPDCNNVRPALAFFIASKPCAH